MLKEAGVDDLTVAELSGWEIQEITSND